MTLLQQRRPAAAGARTDPAGLRVLGLVLTAVVVTVVAGLAVTGGGAATGRAAGLADAGPLTARLLPVSRSLFDLTAIGAIGTVTALAWLVPDNAVAQARLRRAAAGWAWLWAAAGTTYLLASVSQVVGMPVADLPRHTALLWYGVDLPQGRAMVLVVVGASALALWIGTVRTRAGARAWAIVAPALLAPLLTTGHAATASNHFLATQALLVHVLAATLWMGGLLALVVHLRPCASVLPVAVTRFSHLALVCCAAVGVSGLAGAWTRLGATPALWTSTYGGLLLLKTVLLVLVGALGWRHRRRSIPALVVGRTGAFARLAVVELALMGVAVGLAVVLARTAPPIAASLRAVPPHAVAYPTVDPTLAPLGPVTALTAFRHDALMLSAVLVACGLFLAWAWRARVGGLVARSSAGPGSRRGRDGVGAGGRPRGLLHGPAQRPGRPGARAGAGRASAAGRRACSRASGGAGTSPARESVARAGAPLPRGPGARGRAGGGAADRGPPAVPPRAS